MSECDTNLLSVAVHECIPVCNIKFIPCFPNSLKATDLECLFKIDF